MSVINAVELDVFLEPSEYSADRVVGCLLAEWAKQFGARNLVYVYSDMKLLEPAVADALFDSFVDRQAVDLYIDVSDVAAYAARRIDVLPSCERWVLRFEPVASECACHDVQVRASLIGAVRD